MATPVERAKFVETNVSADLQYIWSDSGVDEEIQYRLAQRYISVRRFASMADDRADLKKALKDELTLEATTSPDDRAKVAAIICAFESAKEFMEQETKVRAEQRALGATRQLSASEKTVMRRSVEATYGAIPDKECPSPEYLAVKLEEIEDGEYQASTLDTITSRVETTGLDIETILDSSGHMRVIRKKSKGKMPVDTEEYRIKMRVEANLWLMIAAKMKTKPFLQGLTQQSFYKFVDHILGDKVATLKVPDPVNGNMVPVSPPWTIVLHYEHKLREAAFRLVRDEDKTLDEALKLVIRDAELKELHFTGILAVTAKRSSSSQSSHQKEDEGSKYRKTKGKGKSKGSGKGKKGGRGKQVRLLWKTEDGRNICFNYNSAKGCAGNCNMVHICRYPGCGKAHPCHDNHA